MNSPAFYVIFGLLAAAPFVFTLALIIREKVLLKRTVKPIEFYPPEGFSPVDVFAEYYAARVKPRNLFNPLMLYWADKGYISVEEDCRRGLKLTKLKNLEQPVNASDNRWKTFEIEKKLFDCLFDHGITTFFTLTAGSAYKGDFDNFKKECKDVAKHAASDKTLRVKAAVIAVSILVLIITAIALGSLSGKAEYLMLIFPIVGFIFLSFVPAIGVFKYVFFGVWGGIPFFVFLSSTNHISNFLIIAEFALAFVTLNVLLPLLNLRSDKNRAIWGRLEGFKTFLLNAEKSEIELLVEENPNYYFSVLPYCYIFKITEKVKYKFDRINLEGPGWYLEDNEDFTNIRDVLMP